MTETMHISNYEPMRTFKWFMSTHNSEEMHILAISDLEETHKFTKFNLEETHKSV